MENYNFSPEYITHMKESLKEELYVEEPIEKEITDNTDLLNFLEQ